MPNPTIAKLAASTLALGVTMVGCKPATHGSRPRSTAQTAITPERQANIAAAAAVAATRGGDLDEAVRQAELAVSLAPRDAGYRATLAEAYLKSGRFDSAAATYRDVLRLNPGDARSSLSLALTQIGLGRNADAIATLSAVATRIPAADHGLALALAGDKEGAVRLLSAAAREEGATGRVRQNLALAHALAGDWLQARTIAAQDVSGDELDARMAKWAEFTQPKQTYDQVATLLGVTRVLDAGQPTRLALVDAVAPPVQVAAAEPIAPVYVPAEPVAVAQVAPVDTAPVLAAAMASVESVLPVQMARPVTRTIRAAATAPAAFKGRYVVQIGAFASAASVERAWNGAVSKYDRLADYAPASTQIGVGRGALTRLSVGGFASRGPATDLCNSLRRAGGSCFVRATAGDAPVRWASRVSRNG